MEKSIFCKLKLIVILLVIMTVLVGCSASVQQNPYTAEEFIMSTYVTQTVFSGESGEKAAKEANMQLKAHEQELSMFVNGSEVDKINKSAGLSPVTVSSYTFELIEKALEYSKASEGAFDITIAPLTKLWAIDSDAPHIPSDKELSEVLSLVNYENVILDFEKSTVFLKNKSMAIDLGGVAKGYLLGEVKSEYEKNKVQGGFCSIGGNIFTYKEKSDGKAFTLGIRDPLGSSSDIVGKLTSTDETVATTGGYERYFEKDGRSYHHILDTKTGLPVENDMLSVTVISKDGGLSDFLSTAIFIKNGVIDGALEKYLESKSFEVIIIDKEKNIRCSETLKGRFTLTNNKYTLSYEK